MQAGPLRRIGYSFLGLLAGNAVLLLWMLGNSLHEVLEMLRIHRGSPGTLIPATLEMSLIYFVFSVSGWAVAGIPLALAISARGILRLSWWVLPIGIISGPVSLLLVFLMIPSSHLNLARWREGLLFAILPAVISTTASAVYFALIRHRIERGENLQV